MILHHIVEWLNCIKVVRVARASCPIDLVDTSWAVGVIHCVLESQPDTPSVSTLTITHYFIYAGSQRFCLRRLSSSWLDLLELSLAVSLGPADRRESI